MAMYALRVKARKLRKQGKPLNEICRILGVSKSTVSVWCRDIELSEFLKQNIKKAHILKTQKGRLLGARKNKQKRLIALQSGVDFGKKTVGKISKRELVLIVTALYWSEGSKSESSTGFQFVNSDPSMILMVKKFLVSVMKVPVSDLACSVQINEVHRPRIGKVLNFWKNLLVLSDEQFRKPYFVKTRISKVYENHDTYYGICRLIVRRSSLLKYKMLGLIGALKNEAGVVQW